MSRKEEIEARKLELRDEIEAAEDAEKVEELKEEVDALVEEAEQRRKEEVEKQRQIEAEVQERLRQEKEAEAERLRLEEEERKRKEKEAQLARQIAESSKKNSIFPLKYTLFPLIFMSILANIFFVY